MKKLLIINLIVLCLFLVGCKKEEPTGAVVGIEEEDLSCKDSDGGINKDVQGVVTIGDEDYADNCVAGLLIEYYCDGDNKANQNIRCPNKCSGGKCI